MIALNSHVRRQTELHGLLPRSQTRGYRDPLSGVWGKVATGLLHNPPVFRRSVDQLSFSPILFLALIDPIPVWEECWVSTRRMRPTPT
jgi:hypothetical protein